MNDISTTIFYNQRIAISARINEPIVWRCSKVEQTAPKGINRLTFTQDVWDNHIDTILNDGIWCNYYSSPIEPENYEKPTVPEDKYGVITFKGKKPEIVIGNTKKEITIKFYEGTEESSFEYGTWFYYVVDENGNTEDISHLIEQENIDTGVIKIKFIKNDSNYSDIKKYIGNILRIEYISTSLIQSQLELSIKNI